MGCNISVLIEKKLKKELQLVKEIKIVLLSGKKLNIDLSFKINQFVAQRLD